MTEKIIEQILSRHPEISREEILERLEREKRKTDGLISDEILLRMIAAELGVEFSREIPMPTLSIRDLIPGLSDVTVVGRVVAVFPSKTFKADKSGKVASLLIADKNDILRVVLWNDKVSLIESGKLKVGQITRFSHGYTREDYGGRVELHIGDRGEIEVNPKNVEAKDYPTIGKFVTKIGDITKTRKNKKVNITGIVKELFPISTFKRRDSSSGKVMRFTLADETAEIPVVVWNEKVDELEKTLKKGVKLQVVNAKVKKAISKGLEIHVNAGTYVEALAPAEEFLKIADLKEDLNHVNVEGEVVTKPMLRNVKTSKGELVNLAVFELKDETGRIWVSTWRRHTDKIISLKVGDKVIIKNAYVKKGFGNQPEISTRNTTLITIFQQE
ncbi:MAG: OB-fold nucleic acid binding domain-containing protein [Candidatus Bathyarchaeota archaeon]|nr:OB-fold nucleic acid binding domain-containing protein [Candidatus Bathyarchaeota archaeon]